MFDSFLHRLLILLGFDEIAGGPWNSERLHRSKASFSPIGFEIQCAF